MGASQSSSESLPGYKQRTRRGPLHNRLLGSASSHQSGSDRDGSYSHCSGSDSSEDERVSEEGATSLSDRGNNCWGGVGAEGGGGGATSNNNCWGFSTNTLPRPSDSPPTYRALARDVSLKTSGARVPTAGKGASSSAIIKRQSLVPKRDESGVRSRAHLNQSIDDRTSRSKSSVKSGVLEPLRASRVLPPRSQDSSTAAAIESSSGHYVESRRAEVQSHESVVMTVDSKVPAFMRRSQQLTGRNKSSSSSTVDTRSVPMSSSHLEALQVIESLKNTLQSNGKADSRADHTTNRRVEAAARPMGAGASSSQAEAGSTTDRILVPTPQPRRPRGTTPVRDAELAIAAVRRSMSQQRRLPARGEAVVAAAEGAGISAPGMTEGSEDRLKEESYGMSLWSCGSGQQPNRRSQSKELVRYTPAGSSTLAMSRLSAEAEELRAQVEALELQCLTLEEEQRDAEAALHAKAAEEDELRASIERSSMFDVRTDIDEVRGASMDRINAFSVDRPPLEAEARYTTASVEPAIVDDSADLTPAASAFSIANSTATGGAASNAPIATSSNIRDSKVPRTNQRNFTWSEPSVHVTSSTSPQESNSTSIRDLLPSIPSSTSQSKATAKPGSVRTSAIPLSSVLATVRASLRSTTEVDSRLPDRPPANVASSAPSGTTTPPLPPPVGVRLFGDGPEPARDSSLPKDEREEEARTSSGGKFDTNATERATNVTRFAPTEAPTAAAVSPAAATTTRDIEHLSPYTPSPGSPKAQKLEVDTFPESQPTPTTPPAAVIDHDESIFSPPLSPTNVTRSTFSDRTSERNRKAGRTPEVHAPSIKSPQHTQASTAKVSSAFVRDAVQTKEAAAVNGTSPVASPISMSMAARLHAWKQSPVPETVSRVEQMRKAFEAAETQKVAQPRRPERKVQRAATEVVPNNSEAPASTIAVRAWQRSNSDSHSEEEVAALAAALDCAYAVGRGHPWSGPVKQITFGPGPIGITFSSLDTAPTNRTSSPHDEVEGGDKGSGALFFQGREQMSSLNTAALALARGVGASIVVTDVGVSSAAAQRGVQVGDLIVALNGQLLAPGTHKDTFLELLTSAARPVVLGFRSSEARRTQN